MIWFTADPHYNHQNILKYCPQSRPFARIGAMNKAIIRNINAKVKPGDTLYILGDLGFGNKEQVVELVKQLNGDKFLILGNHDNFTDEQYLEMGFIDWCYYMVLSGNDQHRPIVMAHDPVNTMFTSRMFKFDNGTHPILLHGHVHDSSEFSRDDVTCDISINVGVDVWEMQPVSLHDIHKREREIWEGKRG